MSTLASGGLFGVAAAAQAGDASLDLKRIERVEEEGRTGVSIELSRAPEKLEHFALGDPPRLVIDLYGPVTSRSVAIGETVVDDPHVRRVRVGRHEGRLRVVLDLEAGTPEHVVNGDDTIVTALLGEPSEAAPPVAAKPVSVPNAVAAWVLPEAVASETAPEAVVAAKEEPADPPVIVASVAPAVSRPNRVRDPFRPFNLDVSRKIAPPQTPLERYAVGALKLVAIIYDTRDPRAMVEDGAQLGHTIGVGTKIGDRGGVVKAIHADRVVVEEERMDFYGETTMSEIELRLEHEPM